MNNVKTVFVLVLIPVIVSLGLTVCIDIRPPSVQVEGGEEISKLLAALEDEKYAHVRGEIIPLVKEIGNKEPTPFLFEQIYSRTVQKLIRA